MVCLLFVLWIILNGKITLEIALFGIAISAVLYLFLYKFMDYSPKKELKIAKKTGQIIGYIWTLNVEIIKANIETARMIFRWDEEPEPLLVRFRTKLKTKVGRTLLANSITLTPGTITVSLEGEEYLVHCLDTGFARGLDESVFVEKISRMEGTSGKKTEGRQHNV